MSLSEKQLNELLNKARVNLTEPEPEDQTIWRIDFKTILSLGDFAVISGRPKNGKTLYMSAAISSALMRTEILKMNIKLPDHKRRVVHVDTEQGRRSHHKMMRGISKLCDVPKESLDRQFKFETLRFRGETPANITATIDHYVKLYPDTGLIFLDGILDIIDDMNDTKHTNNLKRWLLNITDKNNLAMVSVIHRGFSADKSIGQIGSATERSAQSVLIVEKNKEMNPHQFILKAEYLRDDEDFTPVSIYYNRYTNMPELAEFMETTLPAMPKNLKRKPHEYTEDEHRDNVRRLFNYATVLTYEELIEQIKQVYAVGREWARQCVNVICYTHGFVFKIEEGYTNIPQARLYPVDVKKKAK